MFGIWIAALLFFGTSVGKEVCYERVGCFKDGFPWTGTLSRQLAGLPWSPEEINTRFLLYTRHNPKAYQEISAVNYRTIQASHFGTDKMTHINIPGWKSDGKWQQDMCNVLLKVEDVNCINVDWINGSLEYIHAVNNLRVVGAEVAYLTDVLMKKFGYSPSKVHLIGHSVGAHLAGEAGSRVPGLGRITGLDPAGPYFHNTPNEVRLDPSDANFVDVIHTNAVRLLFEFGAGTINACGHLDFYPNGGKHMPGCEDLITPLFSFDFNAYKEEVASFFDCNHARSHRFYIESILNPDAFIAYPCRSYRSFKAGNCFHCPKEGCPTMGHFADRFHLKNMQPNRSYYFLNTGTLSPFARWSHKLSVRLDGNNVTQGSMFLRVGGTTGKTGAFVIASQVPRVWPLPVDYILVIGASNDTVMKEWMVGSHRVKAVQGATGRLSLRIRKKSCLLIIKAIDFTGNGVRQALGIAPVVHLLNKHWNAHCVPGIVLIAKDAAIGPIVVEPIFQVEETGMTMKLTKEEGNNRNEEISSGLIWAWISGALKPGMTYTKLIDADVNVGNVTNIEFFWKELLFGHSQNKLGAEMVIDISGKYGYESTFCSQDIMGPNIAQILKPCQSQIQS